MTIIIFYVKPWRRVPHLLWLKVKSRGILVHPAVPAVLAAIRHLQAVDDCSALVMLFGRLTCATIYV